MALVGVIVVAWLAFTWQLDWFAFSPGTATPTSELIDIEGAEAHPPDHELYFTTVSSRQVTPVEWVIAQLDPSTSLVSADQVLGGRSTEERRQLNLQAMLSSQDVSELVALERLGYDVIELTGALVVFVAPDSASDGVLEPGDVVVGLDGTPISTQSELVDEIAARAPGDGLLVEVRRVGEARGGDTDLVEVVLGDDGSGGPLLGVSVSSDWQRADDLGIEVDIEAGDIGGPSAGLAWTLAVLDLLTPGELLGTDEVAVTGTMELDGTVGPIGGIRQKTYAVRERGIEVFVVPAANAPDAEAVAGDDLRIVVVDDLQGALGSLAELGGDPLPEPSPGGQLAGS